MVLENDKILSLEISCGANVVVIALCIVSMVADASVFINIILSVFLSNSYNVFFYFYLLTIIYKWADVTVYHGLPIETQSPCG